MKKANIKDYFNCLFVQLRLGKERCLRVNRVLASRERLLSLDEALESRWSCLACRMTLAFQTPVRCQLIASVLRTGYRRCSSINSCIVIRKRTCPSGWNHRPLHCWSNRKPASVLVI